MDARLLSVVVADDYAAMLNVISTFLSQHFYVIAAVSNGEDLIRVARELRPDVIVADIDMPGTDGLEAMLTLNNSGSDIPFVLMGTDKEWVEHFLAQGAASYVHKFDIFADLRDAVLAAANGEKFVSRSVAQKAN